MTAPVPAPGVVPVAPTAVPVPGQPVDPNAPPPDPAAVPGAEGGEVSPSSDQALLQQQMAVRFSIVKTTAQQQGGGQGGQTPSADRPASPAAAPAPPLTQAPATQRTLPSTSG